MHTISVEIFDPGSIDWLLYLFQPDPTGLILLQNFLSTSSDVGGVRNVAINQPSVVIETDTIRTICPGQEIISYFLRMKKTIATIKQMSIPAISL